MAAPFLSLSMRHTEQALSSPLGRLSRAGTDRGGSDPRTLSALPPHPSGAPPTCVRPPDQVGPPTATVAHHGLQVQPFSTSRGPGYTLWGVDSGPGLAVGVGSQVIGNRARDEVCHWRNRDRYRDREGRGQGQAQRDSPGCQPTVPPHLTVGSEVSAGIGVRRLHMRGPCGKGKISRAEVPTDLDRS